MTLFVSRLQAQGLSGSGSGLKQICGLACPEAIALWFSPIHETDLEIIEERRTSFLGSCLNSDKSSPSFRGYSLRVFPDREVVLSKFVA